MRMIVVQSARPGEPSQIYEVVWRDYEPPMRQVWIDGSVFNNKDIGILQEQLADLTPEFRAFVLESARWICEAGE